MDGHYDDRPYKCILCLKVFKKPDKLKRHLKCAVHRETEPEVMEEALEACKKQHDDYQNKKKLEEGQGNNANGTTIKTEGKEQREQREQISNTSTTLESTEDSTKSPSIKSEAPSLGPRVIDHEDRYSFEKSSDQDDRKHHNSLPGGMIQGMDHQGNRLPSHSPIVNPNSVPNYTNSVNSVNMSFSSPIGSHLQQQNHNQDSPQLTMTTNQTQNQPQKPKKTRNKQIKNEPPPVNYNFDVIFPSPEEMKFEYDEPPGSFRCNSDQILELINAGCFPGIRGINCFYGLVKLRALRGGSKRG